MGRRRLKSVLRTISIAVTVFYQVVVAAPGLDAAEGLTTPLGDSAQGVHVLRGGQAAGQEDAAPSEQLKRHLEALYGDLEDLDPNGVCSRNFRTGDGLRAAVQENPSTFPRDGATWTIRGRAIWADSGEPCRSHDLMARLCKESTINIDNKNECLCEKAYCKGSEAGQVVVDVKEDGRLFAYGNTEAKIFIGYKSNPRLPRVTLPRNEQGYSEGARSFIGMVSSSALIDVRPGVEYDATIYCIPEGRVAFKVRDSNGNEIIDRRYISISKIGTAPCIDIDDKYYAEVCNLPGDYVANFVIGKNGWPNLYRDVRVEPRGRVVETIVWPTDLSDGGFEGHVLSEETGRPIVGAGVYATFVDRRMPDSYNHAAGENVNNAWAKTDEKGYFRLRGIPEGARADISTYVPGIGKVTAKGKLPGVKTPKRVDLVLQTKRIEPCEKCSKPTDERLLDPKPEFIQGYADINGPASCNSGADYEDFINKALNNAYSDLIDCLGDQSDVATRIREAIEGVNPETGKEDTVAICLRSDGEPGKEASVNNSALHGWNGVIDIYMNENGLVAGDLPGRLEHELVHIGDDKDSGTDSDKMEVNAYACEMACNYVNNGLEPPRKLPCEGVSTLGLEACAAGTNSCNDEDPCTEDYCDGGSHDPYGFHCSNPDIVCENIGECASGICDNGNCAIVLRNSVCDDNNGCTNDTCTSLGACDRSDSNCDDHDDCTEDECKPEHGCFHYRNGDCGGGGGAPGNDHPDDNASPPVAGPVPEGGASPLKALVLNEGHAEALLGLLGLAGVEATLVEASFSPSEALTRARLLMVPSGGLYAVSGLPYFTAQIDAFLEAGGVVAVLSQPWGWTYESLAPEITAYGWNEAQSCVFGGVKVSARHPLVSSIEWHPASLPVDGYFEDGLVGADVLLRRSEGAGSTAAMLVEPRGAGYMVLTGLYPDFGWYNGQAGSESVRFVRDLATWSLGPDDVPVYDAGEQVVVDLPQSGDYRVMTPDRKTVVRSGTGAQVTFVAPARPGGIYHVEARTVAGWEYCPSCRFALMGITLGDTGPELALGITTPSETYAEGESATFIYELTDLAGRAHDVTCESWFHGGAGDTEGRHTGFTVLPWQGVQQVFTVNARSGSFRVACYEGGELVASAVKGVHAFLATAPLTLTSEPLVAEPGKRLLYRVKLAEAAQREAVVRLTVHDPDLGVLQVTSATLQPGGARAAEFDVPLDDPPRRLVALAEAYVYDALAGTASVVTSVVRPAAQVGLAIDEPGDTLVATIRNVGVSALAEGTVDLRVSEPDDPDFVEIEAPVGGLAPGESTAVPLALTAPAAFGTTMARATYTAGSTSLESSLPIHRDVYVQGAGPGFDAAAGTSIGFDSRVLNSGDQRVHATVSCSLAGLEGVCVPDVVDLAPGAAQPVRCDLDLPAGLGAGFNVVRLAIALESGDERARSWPVKISPASASLELLPYPVVSGGNVRLRVNNAGGVRLPAAVVTAEMIDGSGVVTLPPQSVEVPPLGYADLSFPVPEGLRGGSRRLDATVADGVTGASAHASWTVVVLGEEATLALAIPVPVVAPNQTVEATATVTNPSTVPLQGTVTFEVGGGSSSHFDEVEVVSPGAPARIADVVLGDTDGSDRYLLFVTDPGDPPAFRVQRWDSAGRFEIDSGEITGYTARALVRSGGALAAVGADAGGGATLFVFDDDVALRNTIALDTADTYAPERLATYGDLDQFILIPYDAPREADRKLEVWSVDAQGGARLLTTASYHGGNTGAALEVADVRAVRQYWGIDAALSRGPRFVVLPSGSFVAVAEAIDTDAEGTRTGNHSVGLVIDADGNEVGRWPMVGLVDPVTGGAFSVQATAAVATDDNDIVVGGRCASSAAGLTGSCVVRFSSLGVVRWVAILPPASVDRVAWTSFVDASVTLKRIGVLGVTNGGPSAYDDRPWLGVLNAATGATVCGATYAAASAGAYTPGLMRADSNASPAGSVFMHGGNYQYFTKGTVSPWVGTLSAKTCTPAYKGAFASPYHPTLADFMSTDFWAGTEGSDFILFSKQWASLSSGIPWRATIAGSASFILKNSIGNVIAGGSHKPTIWSGRIGMLCTARTGTSGITSWWDTIYDIVPTAGAYTSTGTALWGGDRFYKIWTTVQYPSVSGLVLLSNVRESFQTVTPGAGNEAGLLGPALNVQDHVISNGPSASAIDAASNRVVWDNGLLSVQGSLNYDAYDSTTKGCGPAERADVVGVGGPTVTGTMSFADRGRETLSGELMLTETNAMLLGAITPGISRVRPCAGVGYLLVYDDRVCRTDANLVVAACMRSATTSVTTADGVRCLPTETYLDAACEPGGGVRALTATTVQRFSSAGTYLSSFSHGVTASSLVTIAVDSLGDPWLLALDQLRHLDANGALIRSKANPPGTAFYLDSGDAPAFVRRTAQGVTEWIHLDRSTLATSDISSLSAYPFDRVDTVAPGSDGGVLVLANNQGAAAFDATGLPLATWTGALSGGAFAGDGVVTMTADSSVLRHLALERAFSWQTSVPVSLAPGQSTTLDVVVPGSPQVRDDSLQGRVVSASNVVLAQAQRRFSVSSTAVNLVGELATSMVTTSDSAIALRVVMANDGDVALEQAQVRARLDAGAETTLVTIDLPARTSTLRDLALPVLLTAGQHAVVVRLVQGDVEVASTTVPIEVVETSLEVRCLTPATVANVPFDASALVVNGPVPVTLRGVVTGPSGQSSTDVSLPAYGAATLTLPDAVFDADGAVNVTLSGTVNGSWSCPIDYAASLQVSIDVPDTLPAGPTVLSYTVRNPGVVETEAWVSVRVVSDSGESVASRTNVWRIGAGAEIVATIEGALLPGTYTMLVNEVALGQSAQKELRVLPDVNPTLTVTSTKQVGHVTWSALTTNAGLYPFDGLVRSTVGSIEDVQPVRVEGGAGTTTTGDVDLEGLPSGSAQLTVRLERADGSVVATEVVPVPIDPPTVAFVPPIETVVAAGGTLTATLTLKNDGDSRALVSSDAHVNECRSQQIVAVERGGTAAVTLECLVAADTPSGRYQAVFDLGGLGGTIVTTPSVPVPYRVEGTGVEVEARLDEPLYVVGQTGTLLVSTRRIGDVAWTARTRVTVGEDAFEDVAVPGTDWQVHAFPFVVKAGDDRVGYTVMNEATGLSLVVGWVPLNLAPTDVRIWTDVQPWLGGDPAPLHVVSEGDGAVTVGVPEWGDQQVVAATAGVDQQVWITPPVDVSSGAVDVLFHVGEGAEHSYRVFVDGPEVVFKLLEPDRFLYEPGDTATIDVYVEANVAEAVTIDTFVIVEGAWDLADRFEADLEPGQNAFEYTIPVGSQVGEGVVEVRVETGGRTLAVGARRINVGGLALSLGAASSSGDAVPALAVTSYVAQGVGAVIARRHGLEIARMEVPEGWFDQPWALEPSGIEPGENVIEVELQGPGGSLRREVVLAWSPPTIDDGPEAVEGDDADVTEVVDTVEDATDVHEGAEVVGPEPDPDQCVLGTNACDPIGGRCIDTPTGYDCECRESFYGDGRVCRALPEAARSILFVPTALSADGSSRAWAFLSLRDAQDHPTDGVTVRFAIVGPASVPGAEGAPVERVADARGRANVQVACTAPGDVTVSASWGAGGDRLDALMACVPPEPGPGRVVQTPVGDWTLSVEGPGRTFLDAHAYPASVLPGGPSTTATLALGAIAFTLTVPSPGDSATVTVRAPQPISAHHRLWKFLVEGEDARLTWLDVTDASQVSGLRDSDATWVVVVRDGGFGDADGVANGVIVDPQAPVLDPAVVPTLGEWAVIVLLVVMGAWGVVRRREPRSTAAL